VAQVKAFRAVRYDERRAGPLADLVAPPYDVISSEERERFLAAIRKASETVEDPRGPIKLDESGNPTQNVYILKVERVDGKLTNTVVHTYPMVSQFWTYKSDDFLKLPAYGRDYPPARP